VTLKWEIPESPDDCLIQEYRNPLGQFDRRTHNLPGHDDLRHSLLRDFHNGASLEVIADRASQAIGRQCRAYISYGFLCVVAEYSE